MSYIHYYEHTIDEHTTDGVKRFMREHHAKTDEIKGILLKKRVLSLKWLAEQMGVSDRTAQRYIKDLPALTSYTHKRRFFTLLNIPQFDHKGIWFYQQIGFSKFGNSLDTIVSLINQSKEGYSREALEAILKTGLSKQIQILIQREKIYRIKLGNRYLYLPEKVMQNKKARLKLVGTRQTEEHFEKEVQKTELIALLKAVLTEKKIGMDVESITRITRKYSLQIPIKKIQQLLLKYDLTEKKTQ